MSELRTTTTPMIIALIGDSDISRWPLELYPSLQQQIDDDEPVSPSHIVVVSGHSGATLQEVIPHVHETLAKILVSQKDESNISWDVALSTHSHKDRRMLEKKKKKKKKQGMSPEANVVGIVGNDNKSSSSTRHDDDDDDNAFTSIFLVICAGENDIGNGISLTDSTQSLDELLSSILNHPLLSHDDDNGSGNSSSSSSSGNKNNHDDDNIGNKNVQVGIIFLGPKLEPWLKYDANARKDYIRMSRSFQACFQRHCNDIIRQRKSATTTIAATKYSSLFALYYVDCLTMFCGDNAREIPGALLGGKAQAQDIYFDRDELHLSNEGYKIWKQVVENCIRDMIMMNA